MSLWLRKNLYKRHLLWLKLFGVCSLFHVSILIWVFFIHDNDSSDVFLSLNKHIDYSQPIYFVPTPQTKKVSEKAPQQTTAVPAKKTAEKKSAPKKEHTSIAPSVDVKKKEPLNTVEKKDVTPPVENVASNKEPAKKEDTQPESVIEKKPEDTPADTTEQKETKQIPENAHVSDNYKEVEALRRNALLQKELVKHWRPPFGVPAQASCEVSCTVNMQGAAQNIAITRSSGIVMYDTSARNALRSMNMPQWTYGKTITINFTQ